MNADYLEIRKNFLSHASMAGMPSNIRNTKAPRFTKEYIPSEKVPSNVGRLSAGANALTGYKNNLDKKMVTMVQSGQNAAKHFNEYQAEAKMSNAASARFMEALNDYNTVVRNVYAYAGNKAKFLKANIKWTKDELRNLYMITSCTLVPTDTDPGNQSW